MKELDKDEIKELGEVWMLIKTGRADNSKDKSRAISLWNKIAGTNFTHNTSCSSCLGTVFYGLGGLYNEYFK
tara:strand:- start:360 stop:575 length:216 start_codon:yes stop_codon:yes gene_type:complete